MYDRPPLLALEHFVATATLGTIRSAAAQLHVTPSAVSHQIGRLEAYLNVQLFHRHRRRLILTDTGRHYLEQLRESFSQIGQATRDITRRDRRSHLRISVPPTFLVHYLLPRLQTLLNRHPDLTLSFRDALTLDPMQTDIDCAVEYRLQPDERLLSRFLFDDEVVPVASPAYVLRMKIATLADVRRCTLIETEKRVYSWNNVLQRFPWRNSCRLLIMQYTYQALTSVVLDQGVALANRYNAEHLILSGRLTIPFEIDPGFYNRPSYYFSCAPKKEAAPPVQAFRAWLIEQLGAPLGDGVRPGARETPEQGSALRGQAVESGRDVRRQKR